MGDSRAHASHSAPCRAPVTPQDMPRPFTKLKALDMDAVFNDVVAAV